MSLVEAVPQPNALLSNPMQFRHVPETLFARQRMKIDEVGLKRGYEKITASNGISSGSLTNPINGNKLIFRITRNKNGALVNLARSYFMVTFTFTASANVENPAVGCTVDPFGLGAIFDEFRLSINGNNTEIYRYMSGDGIPLFTHNLLMNYSREEFNNHRSLFLPFDELNDRFVGSGVGIANNTNVSGVARVANYITGIRSITMPIFINDICPRFSNECLNNVFEWKIDTQVAINPPILVPFAQGAGEIVAFDGRTRITNIEFYTNTYMPSVFPPIGNEKIGMMETRVFRRTTGEENEEFIISNIKNLQYVFMYRPTSLGSSVANKRVHSVYTPEGGVQTTVNFSSHSNFVLFDQGQNDEGTYAIAAAIAATEARLPIHRADDYMAGLQNEYKEYWAAPISSIQMRYGEKEIPQMATRTILEAPIVDYPFIPSFDDLYRYYCLTLGRFGSPNPPALTLTEFCHKMPFVCLPVANSNDYPARSASHDLSIKIGVTNGTGARSVDIFVICCYLVGYEITPDGGVRKWE